MAVESKKAMVALDDVVRIVTDVLQIGNRAEAMDADTALLGALPEFDSMAVVTIITAMEEEFGILVDDDEITAEVFETVGSLHDFVAARA
jgi:acyl carrier protein